MMFLFRATKCSLAFRFAADCPEHVKAGLLVRSIDSVQGDGPLARPWADKQWVTVNEERISGYALPLVGFVSDQRIAQIRAGIARFFKM